MANTKFLSAKRLTGTKFNQIYIQVQHTNEFTVHTWLLLFSSWHLFRLGFVELEHR